MCPVSTGTGGTASRTRLWDTLLSNFPRISSLSSVVTSMLKISTITFVNPHTPQKDLKTSEPTQNSSQTKVAFGSSGFPMDSEEIPEMTDEELENECLKAEKE